MRLIVFIACAGALLAEGTRLLRQPAISRHRVTFVYAGDLWTAPREGGPAVRLTATGEAEGSPRFSPDGAFIAFARQGDVYVMPAAGGEARRLTWHPASDAPVGWTPDGRKVLIHSMRFRGFHTESPHLLLAPAAGGPAEPLPIPRATLGSFAADGQRIAYGPNPEIVLWQAWKGYRGGSMGYIALFDLERNRYEELPRVNANDIYPMWHGEAIYFASDRDRVMNLYRYDLASKRTERLTAHSEWDVKHPSLGPDAIVYENGGWLHTLDLKTRAVKRIAISVPAEKPAAGWAQSLEEAWSTYRDHAFSPAANWENIKPRYAELMGWAAHWSDAHYVMNEMLAEAGQGHMYLRRGEPGPDTGLPGADFRAEGEWYRIAKIYPGGPLAGVKAAVGDYLVAVGGKPVRSNVDVYAAFAGLSGKEASLTLKSAAGSWDVAVKLAGDESGLRYAEWERGNRARVAEAGGGKVGYIHLPTVDHVEKFQKEWKAQRNAVAAIIVDIRNNGGGGGEDSIFTWLARRPTHVLYSRKGRYPGWDYHLDGPKVMLANEQSGSGADCLALMFKSAKTGALVGVRTVGAMIGNGATYKIAGGWTMQIPENGFYWPELGQWSPENYGAEPDYIVELKPYVLTGGRDPQLEKAIEVALDAAKRWRKIAPPAYRPE